MNGCESRILIDDSNPQTFQRMVHSIRPDGTDFRDLSGPNHDFGSKYSPDGSRIAFTSLRGGGLFQVFTMDINGANDRNVSSNELSQEFEAWAPDGSFLTISSVREKGGVDRLFRTDPQGDNVDELLPDPRLYFRQVSISRNSDFISYTFGLSNPQGATVIGATGAPPQQTIAVAREAKWDPSQDRLLFLVGDPSDVFVADRFDQDRTNLTNTAAAESEVVWSPDGTKIAFTSDLASVWVMNSSGSERMLVSDANAHGPVWSPDSSQIAFIISTTVYVADIPGGSPQPIHALRGTARLSWGCEVGPS